MRHDWYVARTVPRGEFLASNELRRQGFNVLLPKIKLVNSSADSRYIPIFPGYIFLSNETEWEGIPSLDGVSHIIGWLNFGGEVAPLPHEFVEQLMQRLETIDEEGGLWRRFQPGENVRILTNGLEGLAEVVEGAKSPQARVRVRMEFMGRLVSAHVPWENLRSIDAGEAAESYRGSRRTRGKGRWIKGVGNRAAMPRYFFI